MLEKIFGVNYQTMLAGIIGAVATALIPLIQGNGLSMRDIGVSVTLAILGYFAKDKNVTGIGKNAVSMSDIEKKQDEINSQ